VNERDPITDIAHAAIAQLEGTGESITWNHALAALKDLSGRHLPPATAALMRRLVTLDIAGQLPKHLSIYVLDVARELRALEATDA
jgi:hypothetical protein